MAKLVVEIDDRKLHDAIQNADGLKGVLQGYVDSAKGSANSMSSGFRTERTVNFETGEHVGGTQPVYDGNVKKKGRTMVGLVYTANYAAQKDNMLNNTLLKSLGGGR